jgi:hypothetical protein
MTSASACQSQSEIDIDITVVSASALDIKIEDSYQEEQPQKRLISDKQQDLIVYPTIDLLYSPGDNLISKSTARLQPADTRAARPELRQRGSSLLKALLFDEATDPRVS